MGHSVYRGIFDPDIEKFEKMKTEGRFDFQGLISFVLEIYIDLRQKTISVLVDKEKYRPICKYITLEIEQLF